MPICCELQLGAKQAANEKESKGNIKKIKIPPHLSDFMCSLLIPKRFDDSRWDGAKEKSCERNEISANVEQGSFLIISFPLNSPRTRSTVNKTESRMPAKAVSRATGLIVKIRK